MHREFPLGNTPLWSQRVPELHSKSPYSVIRIASIRLMRCHCCSSLQVFAPLGMLVARLGPPTELQGHKVVFSGQVTSSTSCGSPLEAAVREPYPQTRSLAGQVTVSTPTQQSFRFTLGASHRRAFKAAVFSNHFLHGQGQLRLSSRHVNNICERLHCVPTAYLAPVCRRSSQLYVATLPPDPPDHDSDSCSFSIGADRSCVQEWKIVAEYWRPNLLVGVRVREVPVSINCRC